MSAQKLPQLKKLPVGRRGDRLYGVGVTKHHTGGPGQPPPGFVTAKTSEPEWKVYWGLARIFNAPTPDHVRDFPFQGGYPYWSYQAFSDTGGIKETNIDFVIWSPAIMGTPLAIRVMGAFAHDPTNSEQSRYDLVQRGLLERNYDVVDMYPSRFDNDASGQAVIVYLKSLLQLIEAPSPQYLRTPQ